VAVETNFYDADNRRIAKQVTDFSQGAQFGSYDFFDDRHQYNDGVRVLQDRILMYRRENPDAEPEEKYIAREPNQIVGQGLYQFVARNIVALARGHCLTAKLVLPVQMGQYDVRISKKKIQGDRIHLTVELNNWFLRMFCQDVEVEYNMNKRRLVLYRGISMVMDKNSKNVPVVTTYHYSDHPPLLDSYESSLRVRLSERLSR
jgi:hypothetical protein